jgi:hypothetical protein
MNLTLLFRSLIFCVCLAGSTQMQALEFPEQQGPEAWLLTYGPGTVYWQRFGHNSIWIRDRGRGLDHTFNFGFFDFDQPGFLRRFVQGRMLYFGAASDPLAEMQEYREAGRTIRAQRLELTADQVSVLENYLVNEVQPENREYLYDYFYANCSTRVRDALDLALDGALSAATTSQPGKLTIRRHVNRLSWPDPWLFLGLQTALGAPIDALANRWEEAFIPGQLADIFANLTLENGRPAVVETLYEGQPVVAAEPAAGPVWWRYLIIGTVPAGLLLLVAMRLTATRAARLTALAWPLLAGAGGWFLAYMWLATNHAAAANNWSLLVLNPLLLPAALLAFRQQANAAMRALMALLAAGWVVGLGSWLLLPAAHDNPSLLALSLPLVAVSLWLLLQVSRTDSSYLS